MRWLRGKGGTRQEIDNSPQYRCCFSCCHVQTGTACLGVYNLVTQVIAICALTYAICHPEILNDSGFGSTDTFSIGDGSQLDSTKAKNDVIQVMPELPTPVALKTDGSDVGDSSEQVYFGKSDILMFSRRRIDSGDAHVALAMVFGLAVLTFMMLYGAVKERPLYLLPFFCIQVFDFIISCLTAVGHYSWLPSVHEMVANNSDVPFRSELMKLNSQWVSLSILLLYVLVLMVKAYFLGVVWACYQYLQAKRNVLLTYSASEDGSEVYLPPDYETAVKMPVPMPTPQEAPPPTYIP